MTVSWLVALLLAIGAVSSRAATEDTSLLITPQGTNLVGFYDSRERQFMLAIGARYGVYLPLVVQE